jgi:hypothetical protein
MPPISRSRLALRLALGFSLLALVAGAAPALAQDAAAPDSSSNGALRVFLDCDRRTCDFDFIRQEISFINWVRDRQDAQVHLLATRQSTGGGTEIQLQFIGLEQFLDQDQVLLFTSSNTDTDDERRRGFARIVRLGLGRYIAQTSMAQYADVAVNTPRDDNGDSVVGATPANDPWNFWVFSLGVEGSSRGEDRFSSQSIEGSLRASRTTELWKLRFDSEIEYEDRDFEFDDGSTFKDVSRSFDAGGQVIKTLGANWGAGVGASVRQSTFFNLSPSYRAAGALEYNIYPYSMSSQRQLTFTYFLGANRFHYVEETLFEKTEETLVDHGLIVSLDLERPWGSANVNVEASQYLQYPGDYNLQIDGSLEYRLMRGLNLDLSGSIESIQSQRYLPLDGASDEEVLLERRALQTDFRFRASIGISYTFGSIYNNVVNSRLTGRRRGFHRIF